MLFERRVGTLVRRIVAQVQRRERVARSLKVPRQVGGGAGERILREVRIRRKVDDERREWNGSATQIGRDVVEARIRARVDGARGRGKVGMAADGGKVEHV